MTSLITLLASRIIGEIRITGVDLALAHENT